LWVFSFLIQDLFGLVIIWVHNLFSSWFYIFFHILAYDKCL
jgi:hypothetical protein